MRPPTPKTSLFSNSVGSDMKKRLQRERKHISYHVHLSVCKNFNNKSTLHISGYS